MSIYHKLPFSADIISHGSYLDPSDNKCSLKFDPANKVEHKSALQKDEAWQSNQWKWAFSKMYIPKKYFDNVNIF